MLSLLAVVPLAGRPRGRQDLVGIEGGVKGGGDRLRRPAMTGLYPVQEGAVAATRVLFRGWGGRRLEVHAGPAGEPGEAVGSPGVLRGERGDRLVQRRVIPDVLRGDAAGGIQLGDGAGPVAVQQ